MSESVYSYKILHRPDFAFLYVQIPSGQMLKVEKSAMATMTPNLRMKTKLKGGLGRLVTGESLFVNEFSAEGGDGEIGIAPGAPGDLEYVRVKGSPIYLANSAYLASSPGVVVESKWQGLVRGFFSGLSLFLIRCTGDGDLWFNTYGALITIDVDGTYVVDTSYVVAFTEGLEYKVQPIGGYKSLFLSGEGLVCRFTGKGRVWVQTRQAPAFAHWIHPFRRQKSRSSSDD
jgi:uncharacterized protein (TIGR00266 family)